MLSAGEAAATTILFFSSSLFYPIISFHHSRHLHPSTIHDPTDTTKLTATRLFGRDRLWHPDVPTSRSIHRSHASTYTPSKSSTKAREDLKPFISGHDLFSTPSRKLSEWQGRPTSYTEQSDAYKGLRHFFEESKLFLVALLVAANCFCQAHARRYIKIDFIFSDSKDYPAFTLARSDLEIWQLKAFKINLVALDDHCLCI